MRLHVMIRGSGATYNRNPVDEMRVVAEIVDEVGCNAHDDEGADPMQHVVCGEERTMHLVRANSGRTIVGVGVCSASHCENASDVDS
jgi:hypothetical protein